MQISQSIVGTEGTLRLGGRFVFDAHQEFRSGFDGLLNTPKIQSINIDLGGVDYLDSSALGMLLLIKELATKRNASVRLSNCRGNIKQILEIANFSKLLEIS